MPRKSYNERVSENIFVRVEPDLRLYVEDIADEAFEGDMSAAIRAVLRERMERDEARRARRA